MLINSCPIHYHFRIAVLQTSSPDLFVYSCGGALIMSQDRGHTEITYGSHHFQHEVMIMRWHYLLIRHMLTFTSHSAFEINMLQLHRENSSINIRTGGYPKEVFAMVHHSLVETGGLISPAYDGCGRCTVQNEGEESDTIHASP
jgi:hypothetical protein